MTTGSANLDSLIDSIQEGQFYLFYGSNKTVLVTMSDQISVHSNIEHFDVVVVDT
jgi:predicted molibdopterin-dependent oxidoreductase YjgC